MNKIETLLARLKHISGSDLKFEYVDGVVLIQFPNGRHHSVKISREQNYYTLTSLVLGTTMVKSMSPQKLADIIWRRNRETPVVNFTLDNRNRLIGRVEQVADEADFVELTYYIYCLTTECDRLEHLLTGEDYY